MHDLSLHAQGIHQPQASDQRLARAEDEFDGLGGLGRANESGQGADDPGLGTVGDLTGMRRMGKETAIARPLGMGQDRDLSLETQDTAVHIGLAREHTGVVHQVACGKIVRAVNDQVVLTDQIQGIVDCQSCGMLMQDDIGIEPMQSTRSAGHFRLPRLTRTVEHLTL